MIGIMPDETMTTLSGPSVSAEGLKGRPSDSRNIVSFAPLEEDLETGVKLDLCKGGSGSGVSSGLSIELGPIEGLTVLEVLLGFLEAVLGSNAVQHLFESVTEEEDDPKERSGPRRCVT
jgi:hypothetical protein